MRKIAALILTALAVAGCSTTIAEPPPRPPATTTSVVPTTTTTTPPPQANTATLAACRGFADNPSIDSGRDALTSGADSTSTATVADAFDTVYDLEVVAVTPGLDPDVASAMSFASESSVAQREVWADTGSLSPIPFQRILTAVDDACEVAGVDMA